MDTQIDFIESSVPTSMDKPLSFRQWQVREGDMLYRSGVGSMSTTHILAHLLQNQNLAEQVMEHFGNLTAVADASAVELKCVKGISKAKAETIQVAFEMSRRLAQTEIGTRPHISSPKDIYDLLKDEYRGLEQEMLKVMLLDTKNGVKQIETVFVGSLNASICHPREIFKAAIRQSAASIALCHNHPSGTASPSQEDITVTKEMVKVGRLVQIPVVDHVVIGDGVFVSLKEEGLI